MNNLTPLTGLSPTTSGLGYSFIGMPATTDAAAQRTSGVSTGTSSMLDATAMQQASMNNMNFMMQMFMMQMFMMMMQLRMGKLGGGITGSSSLAQAAGVGGGGGGGGTGGTSSAGGASAGFNTPAQQGDIPAGGTDLGREIARAALRESTDGDSNGGLCARDVRTALASVGINIPTGDAWTKAAVLAKDDRFREVQVSKNQLDKLPPGAIVVWDKGQGMPYGHVSIALGDGREASDRLRQQSHYSTNFRVFMPVHK